MIKPDWPAPRHVRALMTTRSMGDMAGAGRASLRGRVPSNPVWLGQVHGTVALNLDQDNLSLQADAALTRKAGTVCAVGAADCMPVLLTDEAGTVVAAAHAGWRGLSCRR
jgi:copper oxidase (laccase) domain-containing protein